MYNEFVTEVIEYTDDNPYKRQFKNTEAYGSSWVGYRIITTHRKITLLVDDGSSCCEQWGYISSEDDLTKLVGARVYGVNKTIMEDGPKDLPEFTTKKLEWGLDAGGVAFINIDTDRGKFQFAVYNAHNGYYSHSAVIILDKLDKTTVYL